MMFNITNFFIVGIAAAIGAWFRWGIGYLIFALYPSLPLGTLAVNLIGGFLIFMATIFQFFYMPLGLH